MADSGVSSRLWEWRIPAMRSIAGIVLGLLTAATFVDNRGTIGTLTARLDINGDTRGHERSPG